jgi:hypothetical protein
MENNNFYNEPYSYEFIKNNIKPLDIILFKGEEIVSKTIRLLQRIKLGINKEKNFSHVGMVVDTTIIDKEIYPFLQDDKLYIFESTLSGKLSDGIYNVESKSFFGTQIRELDQVINQYSILGWSRLIDNPIDSNSNFKHDFTELFMKYNGIKYDVNIISLFSALFPFIRCMRNSAEKFFDTQGYLFCSELCFKIYQELGLYSTEFDARNIVPVDFVGGNQSIPSLFETPIIFTGKL